ncbi:MAG: preprotein translocase subunit SecY, partial [Clostridia bacterium]|nr:preprotein translocase subunit SecY [Clostridia bacterium]
MFETIRNAWKIADLRKKILYTLGMIIIFRLGSVIPVPLLDPSQLKMMFESTNNSLFGFIDLVSGGAFQNTTIFAMSITPYINASIIMQLLCVAIPALERLQKEGEEGRKKIAEIQRVATVVLALIQATGLYFLLKSYNAVTMTGFWPAVVIVITLSAGTAFLMWLGEQITEKGVGNGISLIIFAGIISSGPTAVTSLYQYMMNGTMGVVGAILLVIVALVVVGFVVAMNNAERRISVQYAKRVVGRKMYGGQSTHIPIKVASAGVIPVIFA